MAPTKRELNGGMLQGHRSDAKPGRKNNKTPPANTTEHSIAVTSRKNEGIGGLSCDRSNMSGCLFQWHLIFLNGEESEVESDDRLDAMEPDIMSIKGPQSKSGVEGGDHSHQRENGKGDSK